MDFLRVGFSQTLITFNPDQFQSGLNWTCLFLGLWCLLSTAEWVSQFGLFHDKGLLSWRVLSLRPQWVYQSRLLEPLYRTRGLAVVLGARLVCGFLVMLPAHGWFRIALLVTIVLSGLLFKLRKWLSEDGSDQIGQIVTIGATLAAVGLQLQDLLLCFAGFLLIAGQLTISYFLAGAVKLISFEWRSGRALVGVMGSQSFGHDFAARVASSSAGFSIAFCWLVMLVEAIFPVALFSPTHVLVTFLSVFALFHVATALFMGLNTYFWAFLAAYPSALVVNALILDMMRHT